MRNIFVDSNLENQFRKDGYVKVPFITEQEVEKLIRYLKVEDKLHQEKLELKKQISLLMTLHLLTKTLNTKEWYLK